MNKIEIKKHIIKQELAKIDSTELNYSDYLCGNGRACDQILDIGDESQLIAGNEIAEKLSAHNKIHLKNVEFIENISFKPTSVVELGAIIETDHIFLIVATSTKPFEYDNKQFVGVSTNAPLYKCLTGKKIGEECVFNDVKFTIKNIY